MAARSLLAPFHIHNKITAAALVPNCISSLRKISLRRRRRPARFFCSYRRPLEADMSNYRLQFAQKMAMAGLNPNYRLAIAVSGGPDSIALCVLTLDWKSGNSNAANNGRSKPIDGLLAVVVDHGLRTESAEEADIVRNRVLDMGIKCEVSACEWLDGKPKLGHLQEAARDKRYETLQKICIEHNIGVILIAHHADDQAELFILRLSRNSGVLGLAGMGFTSQRFSEFPDFCGKESKARSILLVRPLLEFSKEDMYNICRGGNQQWVEDPTNRSPLYVRNRIRMSLNSMSSVFKAELQATISACRRTRLHVEKHCHLLLNQAVTIMPHGYAVIDPGTLRSMDTKDIYVAKFITLVVQFISQRHRPLRGNGLKLLLNYLRTFPCKNCLTVAGCYLCPAPGSKGTRVLVCCSADSSLHLLLNSCSHNCYVSSELEQISLKIEENADKFTSDTSSVPFLDATSSKAVLVEAKRQGILSDSSHETIISLQKQESENFNPLAEATSDPVSKHNISSPEASPSKLIRPGQVWYFMNRFLLDWKVSNTDNNASGAACQCFCSRCIYGDEMVAEVRCMVDADWMYLHDLSKTTKLGDSSPENDIAEMEHPRVGASDYAKLSAGRALASLKSIPIAARRALPVLVDGEGVLLSIPSISFSQCPNLKVSAVFHPRIPLGGGHSSFL